MSSGRIIDEVTGRISNWESDMDEFFKQWNEWANHFRMIDTRKEKRPAGVSKNITAETTRAVNALASTLTRMETMQDPYFELASDEVNDDILYDMEKKYRKELMVTEFKRNLLRGNRSLCLFGTQIWEEPYLSFPANTANPFWSGTGFTPLSLLQVAFDASVYDINLSDYIATLNEVSSPYLRFMANSGNGIWDKELIEKGIKEKTLSGTSGYYKSAIDQRRQKTGYNNQYHKNNELILWHGRLSDESLEDEEFRKMWEATGRQDDPRFCDITVGVLNRTYQVRLHPTPYDTWHHLYKIGHYIEFELESIGYGVGKLCGGLQKDMNRILSYANDVVKFSLWNMFLAGRGSGLKTNNMNVFPWAAIQVDDVSQIKELRPQIAGVINGLKLNEVTREDFRGASQATQTLQAVITGATAMESSLAQNEAMRALSITAEITSETVIKPHIETMHTNFIDQNPYDHSYPRKIDVIAKATTDKDFRPEHAKKLLELAQMVFSVRSTMPLDFNPMVIFKYLARSVGMNPREFKEPRPQIDKLLDAMRRINGNSDLKNEMAGEVESLNNQPATVSSVPSNSTEARMNGLEVA